jgi:hypothetical protein
MGALDAYIYDGLIQLAGDPIILGILVFGFFGAFVFVQGLKLPGKIAVLLPASLLATAFLPKVVTVVLALVLGFILYFGFMKIIKQ